MTTICFDGKELVADSRITKVDLDKNQRMIAPATMAEVNVVGNDQGKIVELKSFTLDGDQVLAVAVSGDVRVIEGLRILDGLDEYLGNKVMKDMFTTEFFGQYNDLACVTHLIIVGRTKWASATMQARPDGSLVDYTIQMFDRAQGGWAMAGSGYLQTLEAIKHPKKINHGITLESMKTKSARKCVTLGIICDPTSGGPLRVWSEENGLTVEPIAPAAQVIKEHAEKYAYGLDMPEIDHVEALARQKEIEAEHAARLAA